MHQSVILTEASAAIEVIPENDLQPLDLADLFARPAPLEVDLGCGDGSFLVELAAQFPERNVIGIERMLGRVRSACRKIAGRGLTNARIVRGEIAIACKGLLPANSVAVCHIMFPDPWPKRRHHRRRTVTPELLGSIKLMLSPGGMLRLATDDADYFREIDRVARAAPGFESATDEMPTLPLSTFEQRFRGAGTEIYRLGLRKVSPLR